jgi:hypothetical protein
MGYYSAERRKSNGSELGHANYSARFRWYEAFGWTSKKVIGLLAKK